MSGVTDPRGASRGDESRNALLEAALQAEIEAAIHNPRRAQLERIFGAKTDDEVAEQITSRFWADSAYSCHGCEHIFAADEVVRTRTLDPDRTG